MTPEKHVQNKIIDFLKTIPCLVYERRQAGGFNYKAGLPDLWFVYRGVHVEIEVKAPGGEPSSLQIKQEARFELAGANYWRGDSAADFTKWFESVFALSKFTESSHT